MATLSRWTVLGRQVVCGALAMTGSLGMAAAPKLDGLLAIIDAPSPCLSVRVKVFENNRPSMEVAVMPSGQVKPLGKSKAVPQFTKGKKYQLQATCVSTSNVFQNSELSFQAEGRTVMVAFTKTGFQLKRGGLGY